MYLPYIICFENTKNNTNKHKLLGMSKPPVSPPHVLQGIPCPSNNVFMRANYGLPSSKSPDSMSDLAKSIIP